jgi:MFS family permease
MIGHSIPVISLLGLAGTFAFRAIPVRTSAVEQAGSFRQTLREVASIWRKDRDFRRYENFYFIFGFANIMTIPLTQIHTVEVLHADYFDLALINVALVQGAMALTLAFWGKLLDRYHPSQLRGILNLIFSLDLLLLAVAPSIGWVYLGRIARGIALGGGTLVWILGPLHYARSSQKAPIYVGLHTFLTGARWALAPFAGVFMKWAFADDARPVFLTSFLVVFGTGLAMLRERGDSLPSPVSEGAMPAPRTPGV